MNSLIGLNKVLVFSAHPDDLDFGCSGTVAKLAQDGKEAVYCIITNGEKGIQKVDKPREQMIAMREEEQKRAAMAASVNKVVFLGEIDGDLENTKELRKKIVKVIREEKPDIIFAFDPANQCFDSFYRFHRDHRAGAEAVFDAIYPAAGSRAFFPEFADSQIMPHQIKEAWFFGTERPNVYVDITDTIDKKIEALRQHEGQIYDMKEAENHVRKQASVIGKKNKMKYAEAFRRLTF
jgi:LmbE family N-acetylglucosaminyl deacetylase